MDEIRTDDIPSPNCDVQSMARLVIGVGETEGVQLSLRYTQGDLVVIWRGTLCSVARRSVWQKALLEELVASEAFAIDPRLLLDCA